jgi:hypothetical protein
MRITMQRRTSLLALLAWGLMGCAEVNGGQVQNKGLSMNSQAMSLWDLIAGLERAMPITIAKVEAVLGSKFALTKEGGAYVLLDAPGVALQGGLTTGAVRLMLRPSLQFEDNSALSMELTGACITLAQVRERFKDLRLIQAPRGRSLDETAAWAVDRPWGLVSFAFQARQPDCLFRVSLHRKLP